VWLILIFVDKADEQPIVWSDEGLQNEEK